MSEQTSTPRTSRRQEGNPWATGFAPFAGILMIATGIYQAIVGLVAILDDDVFLNDGNELIASLTA